MSLRKIEEPTQDNHGSDEHPAWGMIGASRVNQSPPGAVLFDSDIRHQHYVTVSIHTAVRDRDLSRDWIRPRKEIIEVGMSEAQWASFVSSMNSSPVPCTIQSRQGEPFVPGMPFAPRLQESMDEVRGAATKSMERVQEAFAAYKEKKNAANLRTLEFAIQNAPANMTFAASSLTEHAENVVQKAKADIEAMVIDQAHRLGLEPGDLGSIGELTAGDQEVEP